MKKSDGVAAIKWREGYNCLGGFLGNVLGWLGDGRFNRPPGVAWIREWDDTRWRALNAA